MICFNNIYGTTTWLRFKSSLVRSDNSRRTLVCRWSTVFPFCSIGSTFGTFFTWKFLHMNVHWNERKAEQWVESLSTETSLDVKVVISIRGKIWLYLSFTTKDANMMPILAPANTSHQWWRWSVIRDTEHKQAYNRNIAWMVGIKNLLRIFGVRICRNLSK